MPNQSTLHIVYLALGTNLGEKSTNLLKAIKLIVERIGFVSAISSIYETEPWGFDSSNSFFNMVVEVHTDLNPEKLLDISQQIEKDLGRKEKSSDVYQDRIIDIDIILYDNLKYKSENLILPHPLFHERDFVLKPRYGIRRLDKHVF